jgi:hypothetical protein
MLSNVPADLGAIEEFAHLLARAVRQCRTYPPTNPLCADAIAACLGALSGIERVRVEFRVHPRELIVDDAGLGSGTIVEHELARRLHRLHVASLCIEHAASSRDLTRFCVEAGRSAERGEERLTLAELLIERGVDRIVPVMARAPEVLDVGPSDADRQALVRRERAHRAALPVSGHTAHLYPPDRGWIRVDPATELSTVSLSDLALLARSPGEFATMLLRLTDDGPVEHGSPDEALRLKFSDVATIFASLEPRVARVMFSRLASAVLALDTEQRTDLLQRTILPGLLDGRLDGVVLRDFPDVDLAGALCLLLDLETAAPEVLATALDRLELPSDRRAAVVPLLDDTIERRRAAAAGSDTGEGAERYARQLVHVEAGRQASFADFAAFDLHLDDEAEGAISELRMRIETSDLVCARLDCLVHLVRLEPNPELVQRLLAHARPLLAELERHDRWDDLAGWLTECREVAEQVRTSRPDVADAIVAAVAGFLTRERVLALSMLGARDAAGRDAVEQVIRATGAEAAGVLIDLLEGTPPAEVLKSVGHLLCEHAVLLAPVLVARLPGCRGAAARAVVRALGHAGRGVEEAVATRLESDDRAIVREALRALARIGSPQAASRVGARLLEGPDWVRGAAEEALWHFPPEQGAAQVRALLGRRDFVRGCPQAAMRLLERAGRTSADGLAPVLEAIAPLRYHFWNPARARVGQRAHQMLRS